MAEGLKLLDPTTYFRITDDGKLGVTYEGRRKAGGVDQPDANGNFLAGMALRLTATLPLETSSADRAAMAWEAVQELAYGAEPPLGGYQQEAFLEGAARQLPTPIVLGGAE